MESALVFHMIDGIWHARVRQPGVILVFFSDIGQKRQSTRYFYIWCENHSNQRIEYGTSVLSFLPRHTSAFAAHYGRSELPVSTTEP